MDDQTKILNHKMSWNSIKTRLKDIKLSLDTFWQVSFIRLLLSHNNGLDQPVVDHHRHHSFVTHCLNIFRNVALNNDHVDIFQNGLFRRQQHLLTQSKWKSILLPTNYSINLTGSPLPASTTGIHQLGETPSHPWRLLAKKPVRRLSRSILRSVHLTTRPFLSRPLDKR